jgi:hypothetical protein
MNFVPLAVRDRGTDKEPEKSSRPRNEDRLALPEADDDSGTGQI